jgi:hypothetical protein
MQVYGGSQLQWRMPKMTRSAGTLARVAQVPFGSMTRVDSGRLNFSPQIESRESFQRTSRLARSTAIVFAKRHSQKARASYIIRAQSPIGMRLLIFAASSWRLLHTEAASAINRSGKTATQSGPCLEKDCLTVCWIGGCRPAGCVDNIALTLSTLSRWTRGDAWKRCEPPSMLPCASLCLFQVVEQKGLDIVRRDWCGLSKEAGNYVLSQVGTLSIIIVIIITLQLYCYYYCY